MIDSEPRGAARAVDRWLDGPIESRRHSSVGAAEIEPLAIARSRASYKILNLIVDIELGPRSALVRARSSGEISAGGR